MSSEPSDATSQICNPRTGHGTPPPKWEGAKKKSRTARARQWRWRRGEERRRGATNLDVVVGAGGGEAAGGGVEVEAEHRLLVVPVDLQRPAPHLVVECWMGSADRAFLLDGFLLLLRLRYSAAFASKSLSLSRVWILGEREGKASGGKMEGIARAPLTPLPRSALLVLGFF